MLPIFYTDILLIIGPLLLASIFGKLLYDYVRFREQVERIPGPPLHSILFGNLPAYWAIMRKFRHESLARRIKELMTFLEIQWDQYKHHGVFRVWLGPFNPMFFLSKPETIETLLSSSVHLKKTMLYRFIHPLGGNGLILAEREIWRPQRKMLTSAFHFKVLESFLPIFARHTDELLHQFEQIGPDESGHIFIEDIRPIYENFTLTTINETAMGIDAENCLTETEAQRYGQFRLAFKKLMRRGSNRVSNPIFWFDTIYQFTKIGKKFFYDIKVINDFAHYIIGKRIKEVDQKPLNIEPINGRKSKPMIFLDMLLGHYFKKTPPLNTIDIVRANVNAFVIAGFDTTSMALSFCTFLFGHYHQCQEKAREEILTILNGNRDAELTMDNVKLMNYLECCIKESLRLYPSVLVIGRKLTEPMILKNNVIIPAGSECVMPIYTIHRDERFFKDPHEFIPERFQNSTHNPYVFIPFSAGPRNCIGQKYAMMEIKFVMAKLLLKYRIVSLAKLEEVYLELSPIIKPCIKLPVQLHRL